jgi:hypothetical protein
VKLNPQFGARYSDFDYGYLHEYAEAEYDVLRFGSRLPLTCGTGLVSTGAALDCGVSRGGHGSRLGESGAPRNPLPSNAEPRRRDSSVLADHGFSLLRWIGGLVFVAVILKAVKGKKV